MRGTLTGLSRYKDWPLQGGGCKAGTMTHRNQSADLDAAIQCADTQGDQRRSQSISTRQDPEATLDLTDDLLIEAPEYLIALIQRVNREQMEAALRPVGLRLASWRLLSCLHEHGPAALTDLADLSVLERTAAGRLVDDLVARGLVRKMALEGDKRFSIVALSEAGEAALERSMPRVHHVRARLFNGLSGTDYDTLRALLAKLRSNLTRDPV